MPNLLTRLTGIAPEVVERTAFHARWLGIAYHVLLALSAIGLAACFVAQLERV